MKRKGLTTLLCTALCLSPLGALPMQAAEPTAQSEKQTRQPAAVPTESLVDHWDFEGDTPFTSKGGQLTALNAHGVTHTEKAEDDLFGSVCQFPADSSSHAWLNASNYINTGSGSTTFALWYKYDPSADEAGSTSSTVLLQHEGDGRTILSLRADGHYHTYLNAQDVISNGTVEKGEWQHVAISFDQNTKKVRFYINGKFDSEKDLGNTVLNQSLALRIGHHKSDNNNNPHGMRGSMDEIYVYGAKLTDQQVKDLYGAKGLALTQKRFGEKLTEARTLSSDSHLDASAKAALDAAIAAAEAVNVQAASLDELEAALNTLSNACDAAQNGIPAVLNVEDSVIRTIDPDSIFGINHRYAFNAYGTFDDETMKVKDGFKSLYKTAGFGSIRYPGGSISNLFNWKTTLGPKEQRKKQVHAFYNNGRQTGIDPNFGLEEIASFADEVDSDIVYVYSLARGSAQDASDLIEFLNARVGTNPNGGIDWAQVRSDYGHPEPYNVQFFEIGNEIQQCYGINSDGKTTQGYWIDYRSDGSQAVNAFTLGAPTAYNRIYAANPDNWDENASKSDGSANMVRQLRHVNTNTMLYEDGRLVMDPEFAALDPGAHIYVGQNAGSAEEWTIVDSLKTASATDKKCMLDYSTGEVTFGDGVHGAIPAQGLGIYASYTLRHDGFNAVSQAMRDTQAKINELESKDHSLQIYTAWEHVNFVQLENQLGKADLYDGMTIHPYSGTVNESSDEAYLLDAMRRADGCRTKVEDYLRQMPDDKVPAISEFGIYYNTSGRTRSQLHALYVARCIMDYAELGSPYIQKHCLSDYYTSGADALGPTQQAVIQVVASNGADTATGKGDFGYFATPSAHVFQIFNSGFGTELLESSLSQDYTLSNGVSALSVLASRDEDDNYSIALTNAEPSLSHTVQIRLPEGTDLSREGLKVKVQRLESDQLAAENSLDNPDHVSVSVDEAVVAEDGSVYVTVAPHSFAIVRIYVPSDKEVLEDLIDTANSITTDESAKFTDLRNRLSQAERTEANEFARQALVDKKVDQLEYALRQLLDPALLDTAITKAEALDLSHFALETEKILNEALALARQVRTSALRQAEIDEAARMLNTTLLELRLMPDPALLSQLSES